MLSSSCKKLTRLELVYNVVRNLVKALHKLDPSFVLASFQDYLEEKHQNQTLYYTKSEEAGSKLEAQIELAAQLYRYAVKHPEWFEMKEFQHLSRLLNEQCIETDEGVVIPVEAKQISSDSLQNPSDPDATYRNKGGRGHVGLVVNLVEVRDQSKKVGLILSHDVQKNTFSDAAFGEAFMESDPLVEQIQALSVDGAYYRQSTIETAKDKKVEFNLSNMTGRKTDKETFPVTQFKRNEQKMIVACPAGHEPARARYDAQKKLFTAKFNKEVCAVCPLKEQCPMKEQKKYNHVRFTEAKLQSDTIRSSMNTERHQELSRFRAGIEGVVSALRRGFHVDNLPVRGLLRSKIWINTKILAYNFKLVTKYKAKLA